MSRRPGQLLIPLTLVVALALTGCTGGSTVPTPETSAPPAGSAPATDAPTGSAPVALDPEGTATDNLPYFSKIVGDVWAGPEQAAGRAYIDALTSAGFDKAAMQVTADESTVGNPAESIEFSVLWDDQCLVGQVGPSIGDPVTAVMPVLGTGGCLIGKTRVIDW